MSEVFTAICYGGPWHGKMRTEPRAGFFVSIAAPRRPGSGSMDYTVPEQNAACWQEEYRFEVFRVGAFSQPHFPERIPAFAMQIPMWVHESKNRHEAEMFVNKMKKLFVAMLTHGS